jgi:AraC-like DNA-binding protein
MSPLSIRLAGNSAPAESFSAGDGCAADGRYTLWLKLTPYFWLPETKSATLGLRIRLVHHHMPDAAPWRDIHIDVRSLTQLRVLARLVHPAVEGHLMQDLFNNFEAVIWASAEKLESSLARPAHLHEIALELGLSQRTLRARCRKYVGISPLRYLWLRRMANARDELRRPVQQSTVTEIAMRNHFSELGRFSVAYRRMFGESPSATLRRSRTDLCEEDPVESTTHLIIGNANCQSGAASAGSPKC